MDRYPSLEELDQGDTAVRGGAPGADGPDSNDDFIARERAALGDDADLFTGPGDNTAQQAPAFNGEEDLLGGDDDYGNANTGSGEVTQFESSFPALDTKNDSVGPGGTITGSSAPYQPQPSSFSNNFASVEEEQEPPAIRKWRLAREADIARRDETSAEKKAATTKAANDYMDSFYEKYNKDKDKAIEQFRKDEKEYLENKTDTTSGGTSWERISKLVDLSGKGAKGGGPGSGKERFREMLLDLKKDENAPGAKGV